MALKNKRWLGLGLVVLFGLGIFSLIPARRAIKRAPVHKGRASRSPNDRSVYRCETPNAAADLTVEEESESSKLRKVFLRTKKDLEMTDSSGMLRELPDGSWYPRNFSVDDLSTVLNL